MKIILFISVFLTALQGFCQITFEHAYTGRALRLSLENSGEKYYVFDPSSESLTFYDAGHTFWKTFNLPSAANSTVVGLLHVSEKKLNSDNLIEVVYNCTLQAGGYEVRICNENGTSLFQLTGASYAYVEELTGYQPKLHTMSYTGTTHSYYSVPQFSLEKQYNFSVSRYDIPPFGEKYVEADITNNAARIYNPDHSLWKSISIPVSNTNFIIHHISRTKLNADSLLEVLVSTQITSSVVAENGNAILSTNAQFHREVYETPGYPDKLIMGNTVYSLPGLTPEYTYYGFPFLLPLESSGPKYLCGYSDSINLYNTDHSVFFKHILPGKPGYTIAGFSGITQTIMNSDLLVESAYHLGKFESSGSVFYEGNIVNQNNVNLLSVPGCMQFQTSKIGGGRQNKLLAFIADSMSNIVTTRVYGLPSYDLTGLAAQAVENEGDIFFPNPASETVYINNKIPGHVFIYDLEGKKIKDKKILLQGAELNISDLPEGIYLVRMHRQDGTLSNSKLVVNR